jgi:hypothetical protein
MLICSFNFRDYHLPSDCTKILQLTMSISCQLPDSILGSFILNYDKYSFMCMFSKMFAYILLPFLICVMLTVIIVSLVEVIMTNMRFWILYKKDNSNLSYRAWLSEMKANEKILIQNQKDKEMLEVLRLQKKVKEIKMTNKKMIEDVKYLEMSGDIINQKLSYLIDNKES